MARFTSNKNSNSFQPSFWIFSGGQSWKSGWGQINKKSNKKVTIKPFILYNSSILIRSQKERNNPKTGNLKIVFTLYLAIITICRGTVDSRGKPAVLRHDMICHKHISRHAMLSRWMWHDVTGLTGGGEGVDMWQIAASSWQGRRQGAST